MSSVESNKRSLSAKARARLADRVRLIAKLCRHMEKTGRCSRAIVHELRRACRATEAAAWLLSSADRPKFEKCRTRLKRLRRRAGAVRDIDVAGTVLKSLASSPALRRDASRVRDSLRRKRRERVERLLAFLRKHPRGGTHAAADALQGVSKSLGDAGVVRSVRALDARVRRLAATGPRSIGAIHTLRIAGKRALLAGEIVRPTPRECNPLAVLVDQIGRLLDLEVAIALATELLSELASERAAGRGTEQGNKGSRSNSQLQAIRPQLLFATLRRLARIEKSQAIALCEALDRPRSRRGSVQ